MKAVHFLARSLLCSRRRRILFCDRRLLTFLKYSIKRNKDLVRFKLCSKENEELWKSKTPDVIMIHFHDVKNIIEYNCIGSTRIGNLDECSCRPNRYCRSSGYRKAFVIRVSKPVGGTLEFNGVDYVSLMPAVFTDGDAGRLFSWWREARFSIMLSRSVIQRWLAHLPNVSRIFSSNSSRISSFGFLRH